MSYDDPDITPTIEIHLRHERDWDKERELQLAKKLRERLCKVEGIVFNHDNDETTWFSLDSVGWLQKEVSGETNVLQDFATENSVDLKLSAWGSDSKAEFWFGGDEADMANAIVLTQRLIATARLLIRVNVETVMESDFLTLGDAETLVSLGKWLRMLRF